MTRLLVLPGIGDIYWVAVALEGFIAKHRLEKPEVWVWNFDGRPRSLEYVERIPFVTAGGYWDHTHKVPGFKESYSKNGRSIWPWFHGWRFYLSANGALLHGRTVEKAFRGYEVNWDLPLTRTKAEKRAEAKAVKEHGRYVVAFMSNHGMFPKWADRWGAAGCAEALDTIAKESGARVLLTGSEWDRPFADKVAALCQGDVVNVAGDTDLDSFFGMVNGSAGCFGWCGGNLIHAVQVKKPTVMVWSRDKFPQSRFHRNACRPDSWGLWYQAATVEDHTPRQAAGMFLSMMG